MILLTSNVHSVLKVSLSLPISSHRDSIVSLFNQITTNLNNLYEIRRIMTTNEVGKPGILENVSLPDVELNSSLDCWNNPR